MPIETEAPANQTRTCPECGLSGFASLQGLSVHRRRVHGNAVTPRPAERAEGNARETSTPAMPAASRESETPENSPAVKDINCPACESKISSDGITMQKKSPKLIAFERAEVEYSNLEAQRDQLAQENKTLKKVPEENEEPKAKIERLRAENEKLAKQIREWGEEPVTERRRKGPLFKRPELACVEEHGRKLAEQLKEIQAQAREPERAGSRNRTNGKGKSGTARA